MKLTIQTRVEQDYLSVKNGFDQTLFQKLSPPFPPVKLLRFDGSSTGDLVVLELNFLFFKQRWTSEITEDSTEEKEFYFIDEGIELPFFLKTWRHKHRVIQDGTGSLIRDEINYTAPFGWMTVLLYPALLVQFAFRIPIYKRLFKTKS
jgi:ligand-binding SRPBCC domain-containing protein